MGYDKLERNLIDIIKEEQAKLGFFKEDIRLYYPLSSLNLFLCHRQGRREAGPPECLTDIHHRKAWTDRNLSQRRSFLFSHPKRRNRLCA